MSGAGLFPNLDLNPVPVLVKYGVMSEIRKSAIDGLTVGCRLRATRHFTEADMQCFGDVTRDYNPVHYDPRFASAKNFKGRVCHGLLVAGMITEIGGQIGWLASGMNFRFKGPVYFGDTIECTLTIMEIDAAGRACASATYCNQHGEEVLSAELYGILPGQTERRIMQAMVSEGDPTNKLAQK